DTAYVPIEHNSRRHGKSSYSIKKLITLGTDVLISQSNKPLRFSIQFGFLISLISFIYGAYLFTRYFFLSEPVQCWTRVMVSIFRSEEHTSELQSRFGFVCCLLLGYNRG